MSLEGASEPERRWLGEARKSLSHDRAIRLERAEVVVPPRPGLYAVHSLPSVWRELGLGRPPDDRPLYVGKAEDDLISRDLKTHFGNGRTGQSTLRRSFAALLRESLGLRGMPRNPAKPAYFANYGLAPEHDEILTAWMRKNLGLAVWAKPSECIIPLETIERALLTQLGPPLNLRNVVTSWSGRVAAARKLMAEEAQAWAKSDRND